MYEVPKMSIIDSIYKYLSNISLIVYKYLLRFSTLVTQKDMTAHPKSGKRFTVSCMVDNHNTRRKIQNLQ